MDRRALAALLIAPLTFVCLGCPGPAPHQGSDAGAKTDAGTKSDAGPPDASTPDAGIPDAGPSDASTPDASTPDAGPSDAGTPDAGTPDAGPSPTSATATIGFDGGTLTLDGATLTFPVGALAQATQITLTHTLDAPPTGFDQGAVIWRVDPAGLELARPAALAIPFAGAAATAAGFWSAPSGASYERVGVDVANGTATLRPVRLGSGFVGSPSGHTTLTVYVTQTKFVHTPAGTTAAPADLAAATVEVLVPNASQSYDTYTGTGDTQGVGRVTGVPPSPTYYVGTTVAGGYPTFVATPHATLDRPSLQDGRTVTQTSSTGTSITLDATGLSAWQGRDEILYEVPAIHATWPYAVSTSANPPAAGATTLTGAVLDWSQLPVLDASQGDTVRLLDHRQVTQASGFISWDILDMATLSNVTLVDGQTIQAQATFSPVPQTSLTITVDSGAFFQAVAGLQAPPNSISYGDSAVTAIVDYLDTPPKLGLGDAPVNLLFGTMPSNATSALSVSYGDPWAGQGAHEFSARYVSDYGNLSGPYFFVSETVGVAMPVSSAGAGTTIAPSVGCVGAVTVGGQPFMAPPLTGVGVTPTIAWQAPALGTPDVYVALIYDASTGNPVFVVLTKGTSFVVPSGILAAGTSYGLSISADVSPGHDAILDVGPPGLQADRSSCSFGATPFTP